MIDVCYFQEKFFIWNAEDACRVREEHRIVGSLVGCLPRIPMQNLHLGLPLQLMKEEARLLVEKGFARICDNTKIPLPSSEDKEGFAEKRKQLYEDQVQACKSERQLDMTRNFHRIMTGKKEKRRRVCISSGIEPPTDSDLEAEIREEIAAMPLPILPFESSGVQIHTASLREKSSDVFTEGWNFPSSLREELEYQVFVHFWEQGFFLTRGGKFGGDYLVYPGSPSLFHSFYIVVCTDHRKSLTALEMIRLGRLGSNVKKTVVLCSVDSTNKVFCLSLQWSKIS